MKVYQVYHNHVVLYTTETLEYASFLRDWCAAEWENQYRILSAPYLNMLSLVRKKCDDQFFVMQVGVLRG